MSTLGLFALISIFYIFVGLQTLARVVRRWGPLTSEVLGPEDSRLASKAAFFLLVPPTVLLHELGHAAFVWLYGLEVVQFRFYGYMGFVVPSGRAGPIGDFAISLAGNLVTLLIGLGCLSFGLFRPGKPFRNILLIDLGRQSLFIVLLFYPVICLGFPGDFVSIYDFEATPIASSIVAVVHGLLVGPGFFWVWKARWRPRALLLCSRHAHLFVTLEKQLRENPGDVGARRQLGILYVDAGHPKEVIRLLGPLAESGQIDGHTLLGLGLAELELGVREAALAHLEAAETRLVRPEARALARLSLGRVCSELGRHEEAIRFLESAPLGELAEDALTAYARSMRAAGHTEALRAKLEAQLSTGEAKNASLLRSALDALGRGPAPSAS